MKPSIRLAQSSGGILDGLFSVFKPKKPRPRVQAPKVEAPGPLQGSKIKTFPLKPQSRAAGSDFAINLPSAAPRLRSYASYRTMCVRLCDGYYWPVNSGTRSSNIQRDRNVCEDSCQSETKLFVQYSLGADAGEMRDLSGKPYKKLKTAFLYRKSYDPQCRCKPDPWSKAELMRHEVYRAVENGEALAGEAAVKAALPEGEAIDQTVIRDTLSSETDTPTELDLVTGDGSSVGEEPITVDMLPDAATIAAETKALLQKTSLRKSTPPAKTNVPDPKKALIPKSVAPVLPPADRSAKPAQMPAAKKRRDINARASR